MGKNLILIAAILSCAACSNASFTPTEDAISKKSAQNAEEGQGPSDVDPEQGSGGPGGPGGPGSGPEPGTGGPGMGGGPGSGGGPGMGGGPNPFEPVDPSNPTPIEEIILENEACRNMTTPSITPDQRTQDFKFNGIGSSVMTANNDEVKINGIVKNVSISGANEVKINGIYSNVCIIADHVKSINGIVSGGNGDVVIMGETANSYTGSINGISRSTIVIIDMDVEKINGNFKRLVVVGGSVGKVNGIVGSIELLDGGTVGN